MNAFDLLNIYMDLKELLSNVNDVVDQIKNDFTSLEASYNEMITLFIDTTLTSSSVGGLNNKKSTFNSELKTFIGKIKIVDLTILLANFRTNYKKIELDYQLVRNDEWKEIEQFLESFECFLKRVESCHRGNLHKNYFMLINEANKFFIVKEMMNNVINSLINNLSSIQIHTENYDPEKLIILKLYGKNYNLHDFALELNEVNEIYSSLVHALKLEEPNELEIVKVESGSLSLAAIGGKVAAVLFVFVIDRIAQKYFGNYFKSTNDKIIEDQTIMLNYLELIDKYKSLTGKDYEVSEETITKLTSVIRMTERLIKKNPVVMINNKKFGKFSDTFQTHIQYEKQLLIENNNK